MTASAASRKIARALVTDADTLACQRADLVTMTQPYIARALVDHETATAARLRLARAEAAQALADLERLLRRIAAGGAL